MQQHFENHKRKYVSFFIIAILVTAASYLVLTSEAQGYPFTSNEEIGRNCPPIFRRLPMLFLLRHHPCMWPQVESMVVPSSNETPSKVTTEATTTSQSATSTPAVEPGATPTPSGASTDEVSITVEATSSQASGE